MVDPNAVRFAPGAHAAAHLERAAVIMGRSGFVLTYRDLEARANRLAQL